MHYKNVGFLLLVTTLFVGCGEPDSSNQQGANPTSSKPAKSDSNMSDPNPPDAKPVDITFDDVKLDIKEDMVFDNSMLTDRVKELNGKYVRVRGFICAEATYQQTDIQQFILIRDYTCKFGPGGQFHHNMVVHLKPEDAIDFTTRPVTVEGRLKLEPMTGPNGKTWSIYRLEG